ncbi:MAG TPA: DUF559 domain-containing protein [Candidatus Paceibacterota bacterium]|nr:DUF559 domain-containing protein [Candidatus Paceibacterota bacterium]
MRKYPHLRENSRRIMLRNIQKRRRPPTDIETILYGVLKPLGVKYRTNQIVEGLTIPDAYIPSNKVVIYADGIYWHQMPKRLKIDREQNRELKKNGYTVLRFNDKQIKSKAFSKNLTRRLLRIGRGS